MSDIVTKACPSLNWTFLAVSSVPLLVNLVVSLFTVNSVHKLTEKSMYARRIYNFSLLSLLLNCLFLYIVATFVGRGTLHSGNTYRFIIVLFFVLNLVLQSMIIYNVNSMPEGPDKDSIKGMVRGMNGTGLAINIIGAILIGFVLGKATGVVSGIKGAAGWIGGKFSSLKQRLVNKINDIRKRRDKGTISAQQADTEMQRAKNEVAGLAIQEGATADEARGISESVPPPPPPPPGGPPPGRPPPGGFGPKGPPLRVTPPPLPTAPSPVVLPLTPKHPPCPPSQGPILQKCQDDLRNISRQLNTCSNEIKKCRSQGKQVFGSLEEEEPHTLQKQIEKATAARRAAIPELALRSF